MMLAHFAECPVSKFCEMKHKEKVNVMNEMTLSCVLLNITGS